MPRITIMGINISMALGASPSSLNGMRAPAKRMKICAAIRPGVRVKPRHTMLSTTPISGNTHMSSLLGR